MPTEVNAARAVVEELTELLTKYGPAIERLADHFDKLEKSGVTQRAAAEVRRRPNPPDEGDELGQFIDLLGGVAKKAVRTAQQRRRG